VVIRVPLPSGQGVDYRSTSLALLHLQALSLSLLLLLLGLLDALLRDRLVLLAHLCAFSPARRGSAFFLLPLSGTGLRALACPAGYILLLQTGLLRSVETVCA
jgi:hypothetical protein